MKELKIPAIKQGTVIDHLPSRDTFKVMRILNPQEFRYPISIALNLKSKSMGIKGIIKISNRSLTKEEVDKIAILAPNATVNIIEDYKVKKKIKVKIPEELVGIIRCTNPMCVTNKQNIEARFRLLQHDELKCEYCERIINMDEVELR